jgi:hypothetical protein
MRILVKLEEIQEHGLWERFCDLKNLPGWKETPWKFNPQYEMTISEEEARELGFIREPQPYQNG